MANKTRVQLEADLAAARKKLNLAEREAGSSNATIAARGRRNVARQGEAISKIRERIRKLREK